MIRRTLVVLLLVLPAQAALVAPTQGATQRPLTVREIGALFPDAWPVEAPPSGQTPEQRAGWVLEERAVLGRAPMDWVRWTHDTFRLDGSPSATAVPFDLVTDVLRIHAAVGVPVTVAGRLAVSRSAASMPAALRAPFADLVSVVADAYTAQAPLAREVGLRLAQGIDPRRPLLTLAERDATAARAASIVHALGRFRDATASVFATLPPTAEPIFTDPEGLVVLGGTGDDTYTRSGMFPDPVLLVDPAGNDLYENSAGGACPVTIPDFGIGGPWMECNLLSVSVVADLGDGTTAPSDDRYVYDGPPSPAQGAGGPGGIGILVDAAGNDQYLATMTRGAWFPFQPQYYFDGGGQGYGYGGFGLLLDPLGDDLYRFDVASSHGSSIWAFAQGFGALGGLGISADGMGRDYWLSNGLGGVFGNSFQGVYTDGVGFFGGVGIMTDTGMGDDVYRAVLEAETVDYYAQGFGAFGGVGIMYEDGGADEYVTIERGFNPFIDPLLNCAYGTASFGGTGVLVDVAGNDYYYGETSSPRGAFTMDNGWGGPGVAYGLFVDTGGDDHYEMVAIGSDPIIHGRGLYEPGFNGDFFNAPAGTNTWGTFVDVGGNDTYIGGFGANDTQWMFGIDRGA